MNTKPILFSTEMVQAILEGRKTQTRRIVKNKYCNTDLVKANNILYERQNDVPPPYENENGRTTHKVRMNEECIPQYQIGDILYVRETWAENILNDKFIYKADEQQGDEIIRGKWKPSIHMPKKVARIFLEVVNVKVERLQDISEKDAYAEGVIKEHSPIPKGATWSDTVGKASLESFKTLWIHLYGEQSWNDNPFVWVYEFKVIEKPEKLKEIEQQIRKDIPRCHEVKLNDVLEWITQFYPHLVLKIESNRVFSKEEGYSTDLLIETKYSKIECNLSGELLKYHPKEFIDFLYDLIPKK